MSGQGQDECSPILGPIVFLNNEKGVQLWRRLLDGEFLYIAGQGQDERSHIPGPIVMLDKEMGVQKQ